MIQEEAEEEEEEQSRGDSSPPKAGLGRQATALKEWPEGLDMSTPGEEPEEPVPGLLRNETMKPPKTEEEGEEGDQTVVEDVAAEEDQKAEEVVGSEEVKEEDVPVKVESAGEAEDAGKTVGD